MITNMQPISYGQSFKARHPKAPRGSAELRINALKEGINNGTISESAAREQVADLMKEVGAKGRRALRAFREAFLGNKIS